MQEKRIHQRFPLNRPATIEIAGGASFTATARDVSLGGAFIESDQEPEFAAQVTVTLTLPGEKLAVSLPGLVRWNKPDGFGVQFGLLGARETHAITRLFKK